MIENTRVHRPLSFGQVERVEDKLPASERVIKDDGKSYEPAKIGKRPDRYLGIIEFTDQGMLRESKQLFDTAAFLKNKLNDHPLVLVIFVHGWNHNASPSDDNLRQFRRILLELKPESGTENIVGVYLGWPGNVRMLPYVSYFSRLNAAERVGRVTCTEVMLSLIAYAKLANNNGGFAVRQQVKTIVIGHSMGGLIVEKAFLQAMVGYGLTNAATSDQLISLGKIQKTAMAKHWEEIAKQEDIFIENQVALPCAKTAFDNAEIDFNEFSAGSKSRRETLESAAGALRSETTVIDNFIGIVENWQRELNRTAKESNRSEEQERALEGLAYILYHSDEDKPDSLHHILTGLRAWAEKPESEVDKESKGAFRKTATDYLGELNSSKPLGASAVVTLKVALEASLTKIEGLGWKSDDVNWRERIEEFFRVFPREVPFLDEESITVAAEMFEQRWDNYAAALTDVKVWETDVFKAKKQTYDWYKDCLTEITKAKESAETKLVDSIHDYGEAKELADKLNLVRERPPADLILLINPASEALVTEQMRQVWEDERGGMLLRKMWRNKETRPWIISISSKYDPATRIIYPIAMGLSSLFRGAASPSERVWMTHSAPHVRETQRAPDVRKMITHEVRRKRKIEDLEVRPKEKAANLELVDVRPKGVTHTPLWVVDADKEIKEHNIVTKNLVELVPFLLHEAEVLKTVEANGD